MKKTTLLLTLFLGISAMAQTTINDDHFDMAIRPDSSASYAVATPSQVATPTEGVNIHWDYRGLSGGSLVKRAFNPDDANPNFPNASGYTVFNPVLGPLVILGSKQYYRKNNNGFYHLGFETAEAAYGIGMVSGDANDTVYALNTFNYYNNNVPILLYPLDYGDGYSSVTEDVTEFEITLGVFNYERENIELRQTVVRHDSVVGWGTLSMDAPGYDSVPTLLLYHEYSQTDSFYMNGQPADLSTLNAFGLAQGSETTLREYLFLVNNPTNTMDLHYALKLRINQANDVVYVERDTRSYNSLSNKTHLLNASVRLYPTPAKKEDGITVAFEDEITETLYLDITHMGGAQVATQIIPAGTPKTMVHTNKMSAGHYIMRLKNKHGDVVYRTNLTLH